MKKLVIVIGAVAIVAVAALAFLFFWTLSKSEEEENRKKTEAARNARWPKDVKQDKIQIDEEIKVVG